MKRKILLVVFLFSFLGLKLNAFNPVNYFNSKFHNETYWHYSVSPIIFVQWDYLYGFSSDNFIFPFVGFEFKLRKEPKGSEFSFFLSSRFAGISKYVSNFYDYRYLLISTYSSFTFNFFKKIELNSGITLLPFLGIGPGALIRAVPDINSYNYDNHIYISDGYVFYGLFGSLIFGTDVVLVRNLVNFSLNIDMDIGMLYYLDKYNFFSTMNITTGFNFYFN